MCIRNAVGILLISTILLYGHIQRCHAYTQVSTSGNGEHSGDGPKIYKALNFDLVFPKSFNSTETVTPSASPSASLGIDSSDLVSDGLVDRRQYNPLSQSNEQTNRDDGDKGQALLYITPSPNEAALYQTPNTNTNTHQNEDDGTQVVTQNPINIQQQRNDNSNNSAAMEQEQQNIATGRAVDYRSGYPFGQLITPLIKNAPRPVYSSDNSKTIPMPTSLYSSATTNVGKQVVYPPVAYQRKPPSRAEIDKLRGRGPIKDRFTPSEAVASHQIKSAHNHNHDHHNHSPTYTNAGKTAASSNVVNTYVPPANLYSFPPNNINYPLPSSKDNKLAMPSNVVNSYAPPASGIDDSGYKYQGPLNVGYLPSINYDNDSGKGDSDGDTKDQKDNSDSDTETGDDSIGVLPASAMGGDNNSGDTMDQMKMKDADSSDGHHHDDHEYDTEKEYPTPPPEWLKAHPEAQNEHPPHDMDDHAPTDMDHDHSADMDHDHDHTSDMDHDHHHPDIIFDHQHDHDHYFPYHHSFPSFPVYPHYPEIIYDDHHDHHHHHVEPPTTTTEAPPPEPPPEPRVKKYSYFYIGRKLWYIPLYFTVWFSFYVLWLILKSIARHKVNLPNHYVARRSIDEHNLPRNREDVINDLTVSVMDKIDKFKRKYLN
ncbi:LIM domain-containing protein A [Musca vetustissima]|uniref:LIM domain-containing protein A n=1 Tax=Musca vetustissima TaxID=27455 RepID=UPI002AB7C183|nr:LIM domain-containing protein A [Musca vetustissima]